MAILTTKSHTRRNLDETSTDQLITRWNTLLEAYQQAQPQWVTTVSYPEIYEATDNNAAIKGKESTTKCPTIHLLDLLTPFSLTFAEMESIGICFKAASPWESPFHMVLKIEQCLVPLQSWHKAEPCYGAQPCPSSLIWPPASVTPTYFRSSTSSSGYFQVSVNRVQNCIIKPFGTMFFHYLTFGLRRHLIQNDGSNLWRSYFLHSLHG